MNIDTPFNEYSTVVSSDWIDFNGHLNVAYYHLIFDLSAKPFFTWLGFTTEIREQHKCSMFALESHLTFLSEVKVHTKVRVESRLLEVHPKRFHFYQEMFIEDTNTLAASHESLGIVMNMETRKSAPMPDSIYERATKIQQAHSALDKPWQIGHVMSVNPVK